MLHHFRPLRPNEFITKKQIKALYPSLYLALSSAAGTLVELRNSSHIICHILSAKILNRGAKNMILILLTRASETVKKHTVTQEATTLLPCFLSNPQHTHTHTLLPSQLKSPRRRDGDAMDTGSQKEQASSYKINKFQGCNVQH